MKILESNKIVSKIILYLRNDDTISDEISELLIKALEKHNKRVEMMDRV